MTWANTGILAYGLNGSEYLLNPDTQGSGQLLPDRLLCVAGQPGLPDYYLTPDGTTIIATVLQSVPIGQRPPACGATPAGSRPAPSARPPTSPVPPTLEGFSVTTGRARSIIGASLPDGMTLNGTIYWTNSSGSVLVVEGTTGTSRSSQQVEAILSGGRLFPIPGASGGTNIAVPGALNRPTIVQMTF